MHRFVWKWMQKHSEHNHLHASQSADIGICVNYRSNEMMLENKSSCEWRFNCTNWNSIQPLSIEWWWVHTHTSDVLRANIFAYNAQVNMILCGGLYAQADIHNTQLAHAEWNKKKLVIGCPSSSAQMLVKRSHRPTKNKLKLFTCLSHVVWFRTISPQCTEIYSHCRRPYDLIRLTVVIQCMP